MAYGFLEGEELIQAVKAKLKELGFEETPDQKAATEYIVSLLKKHLKALAFSPEPLPDVGSDRLTEAATWNALEDCALTVVHLTRRVSELEARIKELEAEKGKPQLAPFIRLFRR